MTFADGLRYVLVASQTLWEMGIWVFARVPVMDDIVNVCTATEATGISLAKQVCAWAYVAICVCVLERQVCRPR